MKQSVSKNKFSKIPKSKTNKINFELSLKAKNRFSRLKYDSINKETLDGSCVDSILFNPESLNNSKATIGKNNSLGKIDNNKLIVFTSSLKYPFDSKKNFPLCTKAKLSKKTFELSEENVSNIDNTHTVLLNEGNELSEHFLDEDDTDRIDYRYYPKIPEIELNKENKYYWLATYDKLMKKSKIIKILNYYSEADKNIEKEKNLNDEQYNFKEKTMIVSGFEIYFLEKFNKPFIRPKRGGKIFIKLFLLNIEQINKIFSYINRLEYKYYINDLDIITEKNLYKNIINFNKSIYNYSTIFCLGSFMNTNIYLFSHIEKNKKDEKINIKVLPSSNKLAKLIKVLMINFPEYTKNDFINYLTDFMKEDNCTFNSLIDKKKEVSTLLTSANKRSLKLSHKNKASTNSVIKNIIQKIPTYTISSHNTPVEFNNLSESNINNLSEINKIKYSNDIKSFDFFNIVNSGIEIKKQISEKILKKIDSNSFYLQNRLNTRTKNNNNSSRNLKGCTLKLKSNKIQKQKAKINNLSSSINHTQLINPIKKSLTRTNTNKINKYYQIVDYSSINRKPNINKNRILNTKFNFSRKVDNDKENNFNFLNTYQISKENINTDISFKNMNNNIIKTEINRQNTRNKIKTNFNPFYYTNANNTNNNLSMIMGKNHIRVISSIRKIISQKLNNISGNNSTILKNVNPNNSNNSFQNNIIKGNKINHKKLVCMSNNNSKNKTTEYITPRKKRLYYYYH